ncbi:hypothetical protein Patl1_37143 [Pistacia atlantica]|nr:hypothetical protein Patl1_37143 [Pistacia atlantica]
MASSNFFVLFLFVALTFSSMDVGLAARNLLFFTPLPKFNFPPLSSNNWPPLFSFPSPPPPKTIIPYYSLPLPLPLSTSFHHKPLSYLSIYLSIYLSNRSLVKMS